MGRFKKVIATLLMPAFIYLPSHALMYKEIKTGIQKAYVMDVGKKVEVDKKDFDVHRLYEKEFYGGSIEDLCRAQPYLVLDDGQIVDDDELYRKAALLAKYDRSELDLLYNQNKAEINKYKTIIDTAFWFELFFNTMDILSNFLADYLKMGSASSTAWLPKTLKKDLPKVVGKQIIEKFIHHLEKILSNKKISLESIDSSEIFKEAMYDMLWDSAKKLEDVNKSIDSLRFGKPEYSHIKKITQQSIEARSTAEAALLGLTHYYGSDDAFRSAMNFLIEHVARPVGGTEFDVFAEAVGVVVPDLRRALEPYMPALENFFANFESRQRLWQLLLGEECFEIGMQGLNMTLDRIKRELEEEKMAERTYKAVIDRYLSETNRTYETELGYEPKKIERDYSVGDIDDVIARNTAELERARNLARQQPLPPVTIENRERYGAPRESSKKDRLYVDIQANKKSVHVDIDNFLNNPTIPLEVKYTVNRDACVTIRIAISAPYIGHTDNKTDSCIKAGTYYLYPRACPDCDAWLRNTREAINWLESQKDTPIARELERRGRKIGFEPFTLNIEYSIEARSDSQYATDREYVSIRFYK